MAGNRRIDLLLVNPGGRRRVYQQLDIALTAIEPPVWAGLLANFIKRKGFSAAILDANAEDLNAEETARVVLELNPLLTAVIVYGHNPSASTPMMPIAGAICAILKEEAPGLPTLLLGGHVAALPGRTLREEKATFVAGGEGPYTLLGVLRALKGGENNYADVRGLWYRNGTNLCSNLPAPLLLDLDEEMPGVEWDLLPMSKYRAHNWHCFGPLQRQPYAAFYTSLGCPFHCNFCCIQAPFRDGEKMAGYGKTASSYRLWRPETVLQQIDILVNNYGVRNVKFADEIFALRPDHVARICDLIIARGYDLNIWAYARVDTLNAVMLDKMKKAGIHWLALGIESASAQVRDNVHKGYRQERIFQTIEKMRAADIHVCGNYIFGLPEDDLESMQATLDLALEINSEWANFYCAMAYPGSGLYDLAEQEGWPLPNTWGGYSQYAVDTLPLPTRYLSAREVLRFRDQAFQTYFSSPQYLRMIRQKFGEETVVHIKRMCAQPLEREIL